MNELATTDKSATVDQSKSASGTGAMVQGALSLQNLGASVQIKAMEGAIKQASKVMAAQALPRNMELIVTDLLGYTLDDGTKMLGKCDDYMFAEQAIYDKNGIEGLSHNFAKYLASIWGNLDWESIEHSKSQEEKKTQIQVVVWDIQKNSTHSETVIVLHKQAGTDRDANESDGIRQEVNRQKSILERNCLIDCFPKDLLQRCEERLLQTLDAKHSEALNDKNKTLKVYASKLGIEIYQLQSFLHISKVEQLKAAHVRRIMAIVKKIDEIDDASEREAFIKKTFKSTATVKPDAQGAGKPKEPQGKDSEPAKDKEAKKEAPKETKKPADKSPTSSPESASKAASADQEPQSSHAPAASSKPDPEPEPEQNQPEQAAPPPPTDLNEGVETNENLW